MQAHSAFQRKPQVQLDSLSPLPARWLTTKIKLFFLEMEPHWTEGIPEDNVLDSAPCKTYIEARLFSKTSGYRPVSVLNSDSNLVSMPFVNSWSMCSPFLMDTSHDLSKLYRLRLIYGSAAHFSGADSASVDYTRPWTPFEHEAGGICEPGCHRWCFVTLSLLLLSYRRIRSRTRAGSAAIAYPLLYTPRGKCCPHR